MLRKILMTGFAAFALVLAAAPAQDAAAEMPKAAKKCVACHTFDADGKNKVGPNLWNVAGQPAGMKDGYRYSKAMEEAAANGLVWNDAELDAFLTKPKEYMPKTKMGYPGVKDEADRAAIIEYMKTLM